VPRGINFSGALCSSPRNRNLVKNIRWESILRPCLVLFKFKTCKTPTSRSPGSYRIPFPSVGRLSTPVKEGCNAAGNTGRCKKTEKSKLYTKYAKRITKRCGVRTISLAACHLVAFRKAERSRITTPNAGECSGRAVHRNRAKAH